MSNEGGGYSPQYYLWREQGAGGGLEGEHRFLEKYGEALSEFDRSYVPDEEELINIERLFRICTGNEGELGYLRSEEEQALLLKAVYLATFAHSGQSRGTGEHYINHPLRSAIEYAQRYQPAVSDLAGLICHDVYEDTPIGLEDIRDFLGEDVADHVNRLSKVRRTQKETDRTSTLLKLLDPFLKDDKAGVQSAIGKVIERLDNIRTLRGKRLADQMAIAQDTLEFYVPLAQLLGMQKEAEELADSSFKVVAPPLFGYEFTRDLLLGRLGAMVDEGELQSALAARVGLPSEADAIIVRKPGIYETAISVREPENLRRDDFFMHVDLVLADAGLLVDLLHDSLPEFFALRANELVQLVNMGNKFAFPDDEIVGYTDAIRRVKGEEPLFRVLGNPRSHNYRLIYQPQGESGPSIPIHLQVHLRSDYDAERVCLNELTRKNPLAERRFSRIVEEMKLLREELGDDDFVESVFTTLPDSIVVVGEKRTREKIELTRRPLPRGASVLDYAMAISPNSWFTVISASLNGRSVSLHTRLFDHDRVHLEFSEGENNVSSYWLDWVRVDIEGKRALIAQKLEEKIASLPEGRPERQRLIGAIRDRGWNVLNKLVGNLGEFGVNLRELNGIPEEIREMEPRDFCFQVGLGRINGETLSKVVEGLKDYWENLTVVVVKIADEPGQIEAVASFLAHCCDEGGINVIHQQTLYKWPDSPRLILRISKKDPHYQYLEEVLEKVEDFLDPEAVIAEQLVFYLSTNSGFNSWLNRYRS